MNTDKLLGMLLEVIDYSFLQTDGSYDKALTYPVIDKIQYIKKQLKNMEVKEVDLDNALSNLDENIKEFITTKEFENESALSGRYWAIAKHAFLLGLKAQKGE